MWSYDLKYDFASTLRAGTVALGLAALAVTQLRRRRRQPNRRRRRLVSDQSARGSARAGCRSPSHAAATGNGRISERGDGDLGGILGGHEALAMESSGVSSAFDALSRRQQARVMQRCKDVMARPAQADANSADGLPDADGDDEVTRTPW